MLRLTKQRGEWIEVGGLLSNPRTDAAINVDGCTVAITVRDGPEQADTQVVTASGSVVDAATGDVTVGFRITNPGTYYGTVTVDKGGASGWPVKEMVQIKITDCP